MATDIKYVFVVTGIERAFTSLATNHAKWMVKELNKQKSESTSPIKPPALVIFVHFDFENDQVVVYEHAFPEKGKKEPKPRWKELSAFTASEGGAAFDPKTFIKKPGAISIVDVYRGVRKAPRGTVLDVSVYSHGFIDGPVIANTSDEQRVSGGQPIRTDTDRDGRRRSDFTPHMGEPDIATNKDALKEFQEGFTATGATFRIFGCHVQDVVDGSRFGEGSRSLIRSTAFQVIHAAYVRQLKLGTAASKQLRKKVKPATVEIDMDWQLQLEDEANDTSDHLTNFTKDQLKPLHYELDTSFFPNSATGALTFGRAYTEVIKFVARQTKLGYVFKAAEGLPGVACYGAVPGSGGNFQEDSPKLMFVSPKEWGSIIRFYRDFMGLTFDERNYARFDKDGVATINDRELNG